MKLKTLAFIIASGFFLPHTGFSQNTEKVFFDDKDSTDGYYLAIRPMSGNIRGAQVLFRGFVQPEDILPETKLQNVGTANDLLTIFVSTKQSLCADENSLKRINAVLQSVVQKFLVDTSKFVLGGFEYAGNIVLRYAELSYQYPSEYPVKPRAVFTINCPVDLTGLWHWSEKAIKTNYFPGTVGDGKYIIDGLTKENGPLKDNLQKYISLSPFYKDADSTGNEKFLENIPVRLYYDADINWYLRNRRQSYYDTYMPDGSELVNRLLLLGNNDAEFIASKQPGMRSNGVRNPDSWSIVDETDCVQWIKRKLDIFDPNTYTPLYNLPIPDAWGMERFQLPLDFAPQIPYQGIEDVRFAPGWGDKKSEEYWSYCFLWWLKENPAIDAASLQKDLQQYYSGLVGRNIPRRKIPKEKLVPVVTNIKKIKPVTGDIETYSGTISMLDYMAQEPMVLNAVIHKRVCPEQNRTVVFLEISPQPSTNIIWQKMNAIFAEFKCNK